MIRFLLPVDRCRAVDGDGRQPDCKGARHVSYRLFDRTAGCVPSNDLAVTPSDVAAGFRAVYIAAEIDDDEFSPFTGTVPRFVPVCSACAELFLREGIL